ncbi:MAG: DUF3891 family protein [Puniceicoccaceae bacterium]
MLRIEQENHWLLLGHADHAALAGEFARHWKNEHFAPPEPFSNILDACTRHDDSWRKRDAQPALTGDLQPAAFSRELVGTYDAFEDIDLEEYLGVREAATEAAALRDPYAAVLISMHSVNLLTEQADLSGLSKVQLEVHRAFVDRQINRQAQLRQSMKGRFEARHLSDEAFQRGFEFLQACDSFSLYASVAFTEIGKLRHRHPMQDGSLTEITILPLGNNRYRLQPFPLDEPEVEFLLPYKRIRKADTINAARFAEAWHETSPEVVSVFAIA